MQAHLSVSNVLTLQGGNPGFLERGFICIKVGGGFALLISSNFFLNSP